jgi:hypothetical protein
MCYCEKVLDRVKKMTVLDFGIMKICLIAFALMVAKLWPAVLGLSWEWYAVVFAVTFAYLIYFFFFKK